MLNKIIKYVVVTLAGVLLLGVAVWFIFLRTPGATLETTKQTFPATANQTSVGVESPQTGQSTNGQLSTGLNIGTKVFKVSDGPVAGATLVELNHPTTTVARYIMADTGRVFEIQLDSAGAVARVVSNTTIPGLVRAYWAEGGNSVVGQYMDTGVVKTIYLGIPTATSSARALKIQFLPDNIADFAVSPDGKSVVYLLRSSGSLVGYVSKVDGSASVKTFSVPIVQGFVSWPSMGAFVVESPAAAGVPGIAFSIDAKSGTVSPLMYAEGLSLTADRGFSKVVYQTTKENSRSTYLHDVKTGKDSALSFDPFPENCTWSTVASTSQSMYCFLPISYTTPSYLDLWHLGLTRTEDSVFSFNTATGRSSVLASPGGPDGGEKVSIATLVVSPGDKYLLYTTKGDRALFGVRLQP